MKKLWGAIAVVSLIAFMLLCYVGYRVSHPLPMKITCKDGSEPKIQEVIASGGVTERTVDCP